MVKWFSHPGQLVNLVCSIGFRGVLGTCQLVLLAKKCSVGLLSQPTGFPAEVQNNRPNQFDQDFGLNCSVNMDYFHDVFMNFLKRRLNGLLREEHKFLMNNIKYLNF